MSVLVLSERDVETLLEMRACISAMERVLAALARDELHQPLRQMIRPPRTDTLFGLMPAYRGADRPTYALKEIVVAPENPARGMDSHQGAVLLHDGHTGELVSVLNASPITAIRTAAVSAVATRALARPDARRVAILGAGVQARAHVEAMRAVLDEPEIRVWSRTAANATALARDLDVVAAMTAHEAVTDAEVICTVTTAREPILERAWLSDGVHINAVGSASPAARELDAATVAAASLFVDRRESAIAESGDYLLALADGAIGEDHIRAELGEVLVGRHPGRQRHDEITLFESLGIGVEDLAAAEMVVEAARTRGIGREVDF
jgi:ornithine cyclodeaminase/alanine dehydrogenase-like protein (mu-crystallin family)